MNPQITLTPGNIIFTANPDETLLEAASRQGILLPHGCKHGACGACKGVVTSGAVNPGNYQPHTLSAAEREEGKILFCSARAESDLVIACPQAKRNAGDAETAPKKIMPVRVEYLERAAEDVIILRVIPPASEKLAFRAGQYVDILLPENQRRSYSIANAPENQDFIELHVRRIPGGRFTSHFFETAKLKDILRIEGAHGSFSLREDSDKPLILLATGTGFAPIKSIVEHCLAQNSRRHLHLYWGSRQESGLYAADLPRRWAKEHEHFRFTPVLSAPDADWQGEGQEQRQRGYVQDAAIADYPDLSGHEVYACGNPAMVEAARRALVERCHLPEAAFYADAFTFATPPQDKR